MPSGSVQGNVFESDHRWSDGRRIFIGALDRLRLFELHLEPLAIDDDVLEAIEELARRARRAQHRAIEAGRTDPTIRRLDVVRSHPRRDRPSWGR